MSTPELDKLDTIDDMGELCDIMKSFGLKTKGFNTLDAMRNRLREHLKASSRKIGQVCNLS